MNAFLRCNNIFSSFRAEISLSKSKNLNPSTVPICVPRLEFKIISNTLIAASYEKNSLDFAEIANYLNKNNIKIEDISTDDGDLEDVFVQLTKH